LNALTGNSTDLRILVALIGCLKQRGYGNIVIGDGPNVGIDRRNINVFKRLRVDVLAQRLGVRCVNLNHDQSETVRISGQVVPIARTALEAEFFVNLPKIKTHAEAMVSLCLKNMIGCVVGQDKRQIHKGLQENIVKLNGVLKPHLHIVDGLIAMEGNGPGDGRPVRLDLLLSGDDPFLTDTLCARLIGIHWHEVVALRIAKDNGYLKDQYIQEIEGSVPVLRPLQRPPSRNILAKLADVRLLYPLKRLLRPLTSLPLATRVAYGLHIIQDVYDPMDDDVQHVVRRAELCRGCGLCEAYCPMGLEKGAIGTHPPSGECIQCLYCCFVCPTGAVRAEGRLGFLVKMADKYAGEIGSAVLAPGSRDPSHPGS
jgi:uncharacterized protein (DUF362 family)/NAD-dependent dihydropyrimidine dehydrogenase PreA subunit